MTREEAIKVIRLAWRAQTLPPRIAAPSLDELERSTAGAAVDALLAFGFRYVGPDELAAARLAGKVEGMEMAARICDATWDDEDAANAIRAKITELKANS